ncbi:hypothetical protein [Tardiphaga sp.]|uniref:hypothetical protein n=1 Tax=Tardiphaga sp. TaxID=1926292 RepID=UPI003529FD5B
MNDLTLDSTILQARPLDFWPLQAKGHEAFPACVVLFLGSGLLTLAHVSMSDWLLVTPKLIRIAAPNVVNIEHFQDSLAIGGALRNALIELRCAAIIDRGILAACSDVNNELQNLTYRKLIQQPQHAGSDITFDHP